MCRIFFSSIFFRPLKFLHLLNASFLQSYSIKCLCSQQRNAACKCNLAQKATFSMIEPLVGWNTSHANVQSFIYVLLCHLIVQRFFFRSACFKGSGCLYHHLCTLCTRRINRRNQSNDTKWCLHHGAVIILFRNAPNPAEHFGLKHFWAHF